MTSEILQLVARKLKLDTPKPHSTAARELGCTCEWERDSVPIREFDQRSHCKLHAIQVRIGRVVIGGFAYPDIYLRKSDRVIVKHKGKIIRRCPMLVEGDLSEDFTHQNHMVERGQV